ncbi:MAG: hypothetical protein OQJ89_10400 [Kangiellaceae bacterium]|nr:hypothetical protein [Kangiellaceae bacterium]MCW8997381.1 hypothetical protein [Kangiellaceae bacterium]MCW9017365.1 hypothetical protein [Kangiellaceae bacterium]
MKDKDDEFNREQDELELRANSALESSVENLDPAVRRKLNQARIKALESKASGVRVFKLVGAVSFVLAIGFVSLFNMEQESINSTPFAEVLEEDLEMLEDLEFVYWMAEQELEVTN